MSETRDRIALACPSCSPGVETAHEVLAEGGGFATVRCTDCQHVHKEQLPEAERVTRDVVVSQDGESVTATVDAPRGETLEHGDEFVLDTGDAIMEVRITDLQLGAEQRAEEATVEDVETIWTRTVDNVSVNVTVNPDDGSHEESESVTVYVPGDYEFTVGETDSFGEEEFTVKSLLLRDDADGYGFDQLDHDGDVAFAKDVRRVYAADRTTSAWSPW